MNPEEAMTTHDRQNSITQTATQIQAVGRFDYTLKKQGGGPGQYARVIGSIEPCDEAFIFENRVTGGDIPPQFIRACEQGFCDATQNGVLAGYPVIGVKVVLEGGHYHPVDSSDRAFRFAACQGFYEAMRTADPVIIEPAMQVTIAVPTEFIGSVQGDLQSRRAVVTDLEFTGQTAILQAEAPLAQLFGYATRLRSLCSGQGEFSMTFSHYQTVPESVQRQMIAGAAK
jgi:elongation factor G